MWYYESDGGGHSDPSLGCIWYPKTHYIVNSETLDRIDCESKFKAKKLRDKLNKELEDEKRTD